MNIYRHKFYTRCPNNQVLIEYELELAIARMIPVENIVDYCSGWKEGFHETIADALLKQFGGQQTLRAHHHGVDIETWRGSLSFVATKDWTRKTLEQRVVVGSRVFEKGVAVETLVEYLTRDDRYDTFNY